MIVTNVADPLAPVGITGSQYAGVNPLGPALMFAPKPFQGSPSVPRFDSSMFRKQLVELGINGDLTQAVNPPIDEICPLFRDIG